MTAWHTLTGEQTLAELGSRAAGLAPHEISARRSRYGSNALPIRRQEPWWRILGRQLSSVIILVLLASVALTAILGRWIDAGAILLAVLIDVGLGFSQESRAARAVAALRRLQVHSSRVRRAGDPVRIPSDEIVVGDMVLLESGDRVPADLRLVQADSLRIDESLLTGESLPVRKSTEPTPASTPSGERRGIAWSGTLVVAGRAAGVVVATGQRTQLGEIDALLHEADTPTPLQRLMRRFEARLGLVVGVVSLVVLAGGIVIGLPFGDAFLNAVALAVAAVPEGLPIALTIALSLGVARMARHRALVRSLPAVEALGSTTVIAADKTGTMTINRMTVERVWTPAGEPFRPGTGDAGEGAGRALRIGALSNDAHLDPSTGGFQGEPVDAAIAAAAMAASVVAPSEYPLTRIAHLPYEPDLRCSASIVRTPDGDVLLVKGAADLLLSTCSSMSTSSGTTVLDRGVIQAVHDEFAAQGIRVLAVAARPLEPGEDPATALSSRSGLEFVGLLGMSDPPRPGVAEAIAACDRAGVTVIMVTGDHPGTAAAIGARIGLRGSEPPVTGVELETLADDRLVARLRAARIAARVSPQDKLRIVRALEAAGEVVAVTGDGVNDAPALRAASIGVAMGRSGTDVARDAADIVLADDDFGTIVRAVRQGRITFAAVQKATLFLVSTGVAALIAVTGDLLLGGPLIFLPVQMIWFNLVTNGLQDVGLAFEGAEGDELSRPPRRPNQGLLTRGLWISTALTALWMGGAVLLAFHSALNSGTPVDQARTFALTTFAFLALFQTFNSRSVTRSVFRQKIWANPFLLAAALGALLLHAAAVLTPLGWVVLGLAPLSGLQWTLALVAGVSILAVVEIGKLMARRRAGRAPEAQGWI
jgi:Ca2+-transporting ATPase